MSAAELKQIQTISKVESEVNAIATTRIPQLLAELNAFAALLCGIKWRKRYSRSYRHLLSTQKKLQYSVGGCDEQLTRLLFSLDGIETDNMDIKRMRKATVLRIQGLIKQTEYLLKRCKRQHYLMTERWKLERYCNAASLSPSTSVDDLSAVQSSASAGSADATVSSANPSAASQKPQSLLQRYSHLSLPELHPQFTQTQDQNNNYVILAPHLVGLKPENLEVSSKGRIVNIEGVILPDSDQSQQAADSSSSSSEQSSSAARSFLSGLNPFARSSPSPKSQQPQHAIGTFRSRQVVPHNADLDAMNWTLTPEGNLLVFIPRKHEKVSAPQQTQTQQPQPTTRNVPISDKQLNQPKSTTPSKQSTTQTTATPASGASRSGAKRGSSRKKR